MVLMVLLVVGFVLLVVVGCLVGFCCVLFLPVFELVDCSSRFESSLQKSVLQRQAKIDPDPSSVISL